MYIIEHSYTQIEQSQKCKNVLPLQKVTTAIVSNKLQIYMLYNALEPEVYSVLTLEFKALECHNRHCQ